MGVYSETETTNITTLSVTVIFIMSTDLWEFSVRLSKV